LTVSRNGSPQARITAIVIIEPTPRGNRKLLLTPSLLTRQGTLWQLLES
jgi:hypothetical protein